MKPLRFDPKKETFEQFKGKLIIDRIIDTYEEQLKELFLIRNPRFKFNQNYQEELTEFLRIHRGKKSFEEMGAWFYFPWNKFLVHYFSDKVHQELRTARNKNLITHEEQERFYRFKVGVAGLSVGSHAALTLAMMGGGQTIKLADPDTISGSNLNRLRYDFSMVGMPKCDIAARQIYQINPYAEIHLYEEGITEETIREFLEGPPKIDVVIEEMDNLETKIRLRLEAKKLRIPVLMATDNGDNVIVDIERYDLNPELPIFNGAVGDLTLEEFQTMRPQDLPRLATKIAGPNFVVPRMQASLLEVGKTLYSWPQLGSAATLSGVALSYIVKRLSLGEGLRTGKLEINFDAIFDPAYLEKESMYGREKAREQFFQAIGLEYEKGDSKKNH